MPRREVWRPAGAFSAAWRGNCPVKASARDRVSGRHCEQLRLHREDFGPHACHADCNVTGLIMGYTPALAGIVRKFSERSHARMNTG
jgi:hypothetical protein